MKICYFFSDIDKSDYTAQPGIIYRLAIEACNHGHDVYTVSNRVDDSYKCDSRINLLTVSGEGSLTTYLKNIFRIYRYMKRVKPDLVHVHGMMFTVYIWPIAKVLDIKIIASTCETIEMYPRCLQKMLCSLFNSIEKMIVTSVYIKNKLVKHKLNEENIIVSRLGLREQFCKVKADTSSNTDVLYWGDASFDRGFDHIAKLIKSLPDVKFNILLRWSKKECGDLLNEIAILNNVKVLIYPYKKHLTEYIEDAKIVVLPFKWMGVRPPLSIVEAMASKKCVIASNMPGTDEIITNTIDGYMIDFNDVESTMGLIKNLLLDDKKKNLIAETAQKKITNLYSNQETYTVLQTYHDIKLEKYEQSNQSI